MKRIQISGGLYACLLFDTLYVTPLLFLPSSMIQAAGQEGWLAILVGALIGLVPATVGVYTCVRHPGKEPVQIARMVLGNWLGRVLGALFAGFSLWIFSLVLRDLYDFVSLVLLNRTPGWAIVGSMLLVVVYGVLAGLEPVARVSFQAMIALVGTTLLGLVLSTAEFSPLQREPFLFHGLASVLHGAVDASQWFGESIYVMTLIPLLKYPERAIRWTAAGMMCAALLLALEVLAISLALGPDLPARLMYPVFDLSQMVRLGSAMERLEVLLVVVWVSGIFIKLALTLHAAVTATAHTIGISNHRILTPVLAAAGMLLTRVWPSTLDLAHWGASGQETATHLTVEFTIPLVLLAGSLLHTASKRRRQTSA